MQWLWLYWRSERSQVRQAASRRLQLPLLSSTSTRPIFVDDRPPITPRHVTSPTRTSIQQQSVSPTTSAESEALGANARSELIKRPWTAAGGSVLDELVSWRKLKEPLQRYLEFVDCNYFGNADQRLEDDSATSTDNIRSPNSVGKLQQDNGRLLQRPRAKPLRISSRHQQHCQSSGSDGNDLPLLHRRSY